MGLVMAIWAKPRRKRVANYVLSKRVKTVFWRIIALNVLRWAQKVAKRVDSETFHTFPFRHHMPPSDSI